MATHHIVGAVAFWVGLLFFVVGVWAPEWHWAPRYVVWTAVAVWQIDFVLDEFARRASASAARP